MANATSSLNGGTLDLLANIIREARSNPSTILDSLNTYSRSLTLALSDAINNAKSEGSLAVLDSLNAYWHNIVTSLSETAKAVGSNPLVANLVSSIRKHWHKAVGLLPISRRSLYNPLFSFIFNYL